ncbi:hypothetical protein [Chlorobium sp.]
MGEYAVAFGQVLNSLVPWTVFAFGAVATIWGIVEAQRSRYNGLSNGGEQ